MKPLEKIISLGKALALGTVMATSCMSNSSYVRRTYTGTPEQQRAAAYSNMKNILEEICPEFTISSSGFRCIQYTQAQGAIASDYRWSEIKQVECLGKKVEITGKYDSTLIYTFGLTWEKVNPQCQDVADAMRVYLGKNKL